MIYTVTLNPSIDYTVSMEMFLAGKLNRVSESSYLPGGKGINVSLVLKELGINSTAFGFVAGFTGDEIERVLQEQGIGTVMLKTESGNSRINVKIKSTLDDAETEINGIGPKIEKEDLDALEDELCKLEEGDVLVLAGSVPPSVPDTIYEQICQKMQQKKVAVVVDAEKELLLKVLKYRPFLVKPNHYELGNLFGEELRTKKEIISRGKKLLQMGARNVIVSMAGQGAVYLSESGEVYHMQAPKGKVINSIGSGDSLVAGFLAGMEKFGQYPDAGERALHLAVCCGSACAFSKELPKYREIERIWKETERQDLV